MVTLQVQVLGRLDWTESLPGASAPAGPDPGAGGLVVPGFSPPSRPHLRLSTSAAGAVGVLDGPGTDGRTVVRFPPSGPETIRAPERVLAAVGRTDGVWALTADALSAVGAAGAVGTSAPVRADRIVGALVTPDTTWALDSGAASFVRSDGSTDRIAVPGWHPSGAAAFGDSVICLDVDRPDQLVEIRPDGTRHRRPAPFHVEPFERLVGYDGSTVLLSALTRLRRVGAVDDALEIVGCGCTDEAVYVAVRTAAEAWLITSQAAPEPLRLAAGERVLAVAGGRVLVSSRTSARWIAAGDAADTSNETIELTAETYAREVEPYAWQPPPGFAVEASSPDDLLLTASGPTGSVVLSLSWSSEPLRRTG